MIKSTIIMSNYFINKQMKLSIFSCFILTLTIQSQIAINLGPFNTSISDPIAKSQERRATSVDRLMLPKITAMAVQATAVKTFVVNYENSLRIISPALLFYQTIVRAFLDQCIQYIVAKSSFAGSIPGLSKLAAKTRLISFFQTRKIRTLKDELRTLFKLDNYMTEGERKVILLDIIDRALKIAI